MEEVLEREARGARELRGRIALLDARAGGGAGLAGGSAAGRDRGEEVLRRAQRALSAARERRGRADGVGSAPTVAKAVACLAQRDLFAPCYEELAAFLRAVPAAVGAADAVEELLGQYSRLTHQWRALVEEQERRLTEEVVQARDALERAEGAAETLLRVAERLEQENAELSARAVQGTAGGAWPRASPTPSPAPAPAAVTTPAPTPPPRFSSGTGWTGGPPGGS